MKTTFREAHDDTVLEWLPRRGRWLGPAITGFAFALGFGAGSFFPVRAPEPCPAPRPAEEPHPAPVAERETEDEVPAAAAAPEKKQPRTFTAPASASSVLVDVRIDSDPQGATVFTGEGQLGKTPLTAFLPVARVTHVRLALAGYRGAQVKWSGATGQSSIFKALEKEGAD